MFVFSVRLLRYPPFLLSASFSPSSPRITFSFIPFSHSVAASPIPSSFHAGTRVWLFVTPFSSSTTVCRLFALCALVSLCVYTPLSFSFLFRVFPKRVYYSSLPGSRMYVCMCRALKLCAQLRVSDGEDTEYISAPVGRGAKELDGRDCRMRPYNLFFFAVGANDRAKWLRRVSVAE